MSSVSWSQVRQTVKTGGGIPEAMYNLVLDEAKAYVTAKGAPGIKFKFKVEDGEWKGAVVSHNPSLQLEYAGLVISFMSDLSVLGVPDNFLTDERQMDEIAAYIMTQPRRCRAETEVNEYNNTKTNRLKKNTNLLPALGAGGGSFSIAPPPAFSAPSGFAAPPPPPVDQDSLPF